MKAAPPRSSMLIGSGLLGLAGLFSSVVACGGGSDSTNAGASGGTSGLIATGGKPAVGVGGSPVTSGSSGSTVGGASGTTRSGGGGSSSGSSGSSGTMGGAGGSGGTGVGASGASGGSGSTSTGGAGVLSSGGRSPGVGGAGGSEPSTGPCPKGQTFPAPILTGTVALVVQTAGNGLYEGTVWLPSRGTLAFSDMTFSGEPVPSEVHELTLPNTVKTLLANSGTNGLALAPDGTIVAGAHDIQGIVRIDPATGTRTTIVSKFQGKSFNSPNDLTVRSDGTIYFTDPDYQLGKARTSETKVTGVYRISPTGEVTSVDSTLSEPNGIGLSPDQTVLYVNEMSNPGRVVSFAVAADGTVSGRKDFAAVATPDGLGIDCGGNVYVASNTAGKVQVFAPDGKSLGSITVATNLTNLAFGGPDRKTLFISAGKAIYSLPMNLPGFPN